jgi:hypothetical protein
LLIFACSCYWRRYIPCNWPAQKEQEIWTSRRGQGAVFVFAAWGTSPPYFFSWKVVLAPNLKMVLLCTVKLL